MESPAVPAGPPHPPRAGISWIHFVFLGLIVLTGLAAAVLMWLAKPRGTQTSSTETALPVHARITTPLVALERSGREVSTESLKGKVWTVAFTYTRCPRGCLGVVATMVDLHKEFGHNPRFHQVSISITPELDPPDVLNAFMDAQGITPQDPWWFLTGDQSRLRGFMTDQLRFTPSVDLPPDQRQTEFDLVQHDLRIGLVDAEGRLRGFYEVQNPDPPTAAFHLERLRTDIRRLLEN